MSKKTPLDTIKFSIDSSETVVNDTVKIVAHISGIVRSTDTDQMLRAEIRQMMNLFIETDWQFAGLTRSEHSSKMEVLTLTASARVPEAENRALDKRRLAASQREGLTISSVTADVSSPPSVVAETERKLRIKIIELAKQEQKALCEALGRSLDIHRIKFLPPELPYNSNARMSASNASAKTSYGTGFNSEDDAIGNAQKLTMTAEVTLAIV